VRWGLRIFSSVVESSTPPAALTELPPSSASSSAAERTLMCVATVVAAPPRVLPGDARARRSSLSRHRRPLRRPARMPEFPRRPPAPAPTGVAAPPVQPRHRALHSTSPLLCTRTAGLAAGHEPTAVHSDGRLVASRAAVYRPSLPRIWSAVRNLDLIIFPISRFI
jgi:hypothetical protein